MYNIWFGMFIGLAWFMNVFFCVALYAYIHESTNSAQRQPMMLCLLTIVAVLLLSFKLHWIGLGLGMIFPVATWFLYQDVIHHKGKLDDDASAAMLTLICAFILSIIYVMLLVDFYMTVFGL